MSDPTRRNRLDETQSPYLRQHADNPVHWQPWDDEALAAARERDDPIFLSIGYSACHWCHVMEEESFSDDSVAEVLNEHFVPIKVDREERPDVDSIYMTVCQLVTGRGGWPLSAWLTPEGKPFYVGTYYPRESRRGMPGFVDVLEEVRESWADDRESVETRAENWTDAARERLEATEIGGGAGSTASGPAVERAESAPAGADARGPPGDVLEAAADDAMRTADRQHGGFGSDGPKFPQPARLELLFRAAHRTGRDRYREVALETLDAMAEGGLYDHVGGGFHRYCVDRDWTVPHFEKMLYDNAEIPRAFLDGYRLTGSRRYAAVIHGTLAFLDRELSHPEGGFYSSLDAQSETAAGDREEGAFYVWTPDAVRDAVESAADADLVCERFGITEAGNFEGQTVPTLDASLEELADDRGTEPGQVAERLDASVEALFEAREHRPRPARDEKVLAGWNGLAIETTADAGMVFDDEQYVDRAVSALAFARVRLWDADDRRLSRRWKGGTVGIDGYLDDYAFLARAAVRCYEATGDVDHLSFAIDLARRLVEEFWDPDRQTLFFTPESGESLVTRPQELGDQSTPSSTGVAVRTLQTLDAFVDDEFGEIAENVLATHADRIESSPLQHASLAIATDRYETGPLEVTVAAEAVPSDWRERIANAYLSDRVLARRPPSSEGLTDWLSELDLDDEPPIWAGREARDGEPTIYVCRDFTCSAPTHEIDDAIESATSNHAAGGPNPPI